MEERAANILYCYYIILQHAIPAAAAAAAV